MEKTTYLCPRNHFKIHIFMKRNGLIMLAAAISALPATAQQDGEGLVIDRPTTITDVSPYQGSDVRFTNSDYFDEESGEYVYSMGSIILDAPTTPRWRIGKFRFPVNFFDWDATYDYESFEEKGRIYRIASFLNMRTEVEADNIEVRFKDAGSEDWMFFSVPYDVRVEDIKGGIGNWVIRRYDGTNRAAAKAEATWVDVRPGETLRAGEGYIFMRNYNDLENASGIDWETYVETEDDYALVLPAVLNETKQNLFRSGDVTVQLRHFQSDRPTNADWNMLGNPYPTYYDVSAIPEKAVLYVWDANDQRYRTLRTGEHNNVVLAPGQPFFVQAGELSKLTFPASGRRTEGTIDFPDVDEGGDDEWDDDNWNADWAEIRRKGRSEIGTALKRAREARRALSSDFQPESPYDPGANSYNPATGEVVFDLIPPRGILIAASQLFEVVGTAQEVKKVTVMAPPGMFFMMGLFTGCEEVDMSKSYGFTTVPDRAFAYMMKLRKVALPACVERIEDGAFEYCMALEQLDLYAPVPPQVSAALFSKMFNNVQELIVRVPEDAVQAYKQADVWKDLNIQALKAGTQELVTVKLSILTPDGADVADKCNIVWRNGNGNVIGVGPVLDAQTPGTVVSYSVGLPASLNMYEAIPDGSITVAAGGNTVSLHMTPTGNIDMGSLDLSGSVVRLSYSFVPSTSESPRLLLSDVKIEATDKLSGKAFTDGVCQDSILAFSQTRFQPGQVIVIRATSRSERFGEAVTEASADDEGNIETSLTIREYGISRMRCSRDDGVKGIMAIVFNADGAKVGRFPDSGSVIEVGGLPDGNYTVVTMEENQFFSFAATLSDLRDSKLKEGTDYARTEIVMTSGTMREYEARVPKLDDAVLSQLDESSYFATQDPSITLMQTGTLKAKVVFKPEIAAKAESVRLQIDMPQGVHYLDGSLISMDGTSQLSEGGRRIVVPYHPDEQVRISVVPDASGTFSINATVRYMMNGEQIIQPLGSATMTVEGISLNLLSIVNVPEVHPHGYAFAGSQVTFYDGEKVIGRTTAKSDGRFEADVRLTPDCDDTHHAVYAMIENGGQAIMTETSHITYDRQASMLQAVSMVYQGHRITWNMQNGTITPKFYSIVPDKSPSTTFQARLLNPQPENETNQVFIVGASDGLGYEIPAVWDDVSQTYVATADFDGSYRAPEAVVFSYDYIGRNPKDRSALLRSECQSLVNMFNAMTAAYDKLLQPGEVLEATDDRVSFTFTLTGQPGTTFVATAQIEDADAILAMREEHAFVRYGDETNGFTTCVEDDGRSLRLYTVDLPAHEALSVVIRFLDEAAAAPRAPRRISALSVINNVGDFAKMFNPVQNTLDLMDDVDLSDEYRREMRHRLYMMEEWCLSNIKMLHVALAATCPNGEPRVPASLMSRFNSEIGSLTYEHDKMVYREMPAVRELFERAVNFTIGQHVAGQVVDVLGGKFAKFTAGKGKRVLGKLGSLSQKFGDVAQVTKALEDAVSDAIGKIANEAMNQALPKDYKGIKKYYDEWSEKWFSDWRQKVRALHSEIVASYDCQDLKPHVTKHPKTEPVTPIVDPSGYVYDGVAANRVEGATATIYYKPAEGGAEQMWDAAEFGQENPQTTDGQGIYMWNVPRGLWQVRFQKPGYEPAQTDWLPVPPPQLDIAVSMVNRTAPEVTAAEATPEQVTIRFSRFMDMASLGSVSVKQNGNIIAGTLEAMNGEQGRTDHVRFRPSQTITAQQVELIVPTEARSYAGTPMQTAYEAVLPVRTAVESLLVEEGAAIGLGQTGTVQVLASPAQAVAGRTLKVSILTPILEQAESEITFDEAGRAEVTLRGILPGTADIVLAVADMEARATVEVKYSLTDVVSRPIANIADGTVVGPGSSVMLFSSTPGATIYYTTDGSCPCDSGTRLTYTGPVEITGEMTIQAIAVREGMEDSEVVTLHYTVGDGLGVDGQTAGEIILSQDYYDMSGRRVILPLRRGMYIQVRRTPNGIRSEKILIR